MYAIYLLGEKYEGIFILHILEGMAPFVHISSPEGVGPSQFLGD